MRLLLAPDKFKGSLTAAQVCEHLAAGVARARPDISVRSLPIADGGDGTVDAAVAAGFERRPVTVTGPTGGRVDTSFAIRGDRAVVELADACGLARLPGGVLAPMTAGTTGLGEVLMAAVRTGARTVVLGVGGSAGTDGGMGMLSALGVRARGRGGAEVPPGGAGLAAVHELDLTGLDPAVRACRILLASDVGNPLLGPAGAAPVYGPQKGATPQQVRALDTALANWATVVEKAVAGSFAGHPGSGAAGGVGFAALAVLGARAHPGIDLVLELAQFDDALADCDVVITGEGSLDRQTLQGKGPAGVAAAARAAGRTVLAVAGRVTLDAEELRAAGIDRAYALQELESDPAVCLARAGDLVEQVAERLAAELR